MSRALLPALLLLSACASAAAAQPRTEPAAPAPARDAGPDPQSAPPAAPMPPAPDPSSDVPLTARHFTSGEGSGARGSLDKDLIRQVVRRNQGQVRACYEDVLNRGNAPLAGKVVVNWRIGPDGTVGTSSLVSSTANHAGLEQCVVEAVRGWRFPKPKGGGVVNVSYPFVFRPAGEGAPGAVDGTTAYYAEDMATIRAVVDAQRTAYAQCYGRAAAETPGLAGRLEFRWTVEKDGSVAGLTLTSDTLQRSDVAACIHDVLQGLRFRARQASVAVKFPFSFPTGGQ